MRWDRWRRSEAVEDYRDPNKPVEPVTPEGESINDTLQRINSDLAKDMGKPGGG